jgi:sugar lactone lactonase YvrE
MLRLYGLSLPTLVLVAGAAVPTLPTVAPLAPSSGIVADDGGTIYFADVYTSTVWRATAYGVTAHVTGRRTRSLQIDADGNIYGVHADPRGRLRSWRADAGGTVVELGGAPAIDPRAAAIGAATPAHDGGTIISKRSTILKIEVDGRLTTVAADQPLLRNRQSLLSRLFGEPEPHLTGLAVDSNGTVYAANAARATVLRIDGGGRVVEVHASESGWRATGVAVHDGAVYVLEYGTGVRVQRIAPDGTRSIIAAVRSARALADAMLPARFANVWPNG